MNSSVEPLLRGSVVCIRHGSQKIPHRSYETVFSFSQEGPVLQRVAPGSPDPGEFPVERGSVLIGIIFQAGGHCVGGMPECRSRREGERYFSVIDAFLVRGEFPQFGQTMQVSHGDEEEFV